MYENNGNKLQNGYKHQKKPLKSYHSKVIMS